jgi:hypothetical protein
VLGKNHGANQEEKTVKIHSKHKGTKSSPTIPIKQRRKT